MSYVKVSSRHRLSAALSFRFCETRTSAARNVVHVSVGESDSAVLWTRPAAVSHFSHSNVFIYGLVNNTVSSYDCTRGGHDIAAARANCL